VGCSQNIGDLRKEAEKICAELTEELRSISTKEDFLNHLPHLKKKYTRLAKIIYKTHLMIKENHEIGIEQEYPSHIGYLLYREHVRILEIRGIRELMQKAQKEALAYLEKRLPSQTTLDGSDQLFP
jgi:hypothetical protein